MFQMNFIWFNQPKSWSSNESTIQVHTDPNTDFWRKTHYGFERDNGHFYYTTVDSNRSFTASVNIRGNYKDLYDQGGLMLRIDEKNWIKCGVEYVEGQQHASVVTTVNGWSDWSVVSVKAPEVLKLRLKREKEAVHIEFAEGDDGQFQMMRLAYFPVPEQTQPLMIGVMCCSPGEKVSGFDIKFENFTLVHDD